jgi:hypothetical protein
MVYISKESNAPGLPGMDETNPALQDYAGTSQETLLDAVRAAVNAEGGRYITQSKFLFNAKMRPCDIYKHFSTWTATLQAAGFNFGYNGSIERERLLKDWGCVARKLKSIPTQREYKIHGEFGLSIFSNHFGSWTEVPGAFRIFAAEQVDWKDVLVLLHPSCRAMRALKRRKRNKALNLERIPRRLSRLGCMRTAPRSNGRVICGALMDIGGLRHAPVNEQGVILLFGILAERLGFIIEGIRGGFPDCEAKRRVGPDAWQGVNIEFEYESRNFRLHGHQPEACDLIVCWTHNWPDCPQDARSHCAQRGDQKARGSHTLNPEARRPRRNTENKMGAVFLRVPKGQPKAA